MQIHAKAIFYITNIGPTKKSLQIITATCKPVINLASAIGFSDPTAGAALFSGSGTAQFTITGSSCNAPTGVPEFPTLALPVGMIIGMIFVVYSIRKKE